jgi:hypothetical protein
MNNENFNKNMSKMKVGDLVRPKHKYSKNEVGIGIVLKVEEDFYSRKPDAGSDVNDRLTILWAHGGITPEPDSYVENLAGLTPAGSTIFYIY